MLIKTINEYSINEKFYNVNLQLECGAFLLQGDNGVGKTSFLKILSQNKKKYFGNKQCYFLDQNKILPLNDINYLQIENELRSFHPYKSEFFLKLREYVTPFEKTPIRELSGGQNQLVKLCLMFLSNADYYFLDEPLQSLDVNHIEKVKTVLVSAINEKSKIFFIVDHTISPKDFKFNRVLKMRASVSEITIGEYGV